MIDGPSSTDSEPLRIAIDAQLYPNSGAGGVASVLIALVRALARLDDGPEEYILVARPDAWQWWTQYTGANQRIVPRPAPGRVERLRRWVRRGLGRGYAIARSGGFYEQLGCDVVHFPYPQYSECALPMIYNPHDLQHLHLPQFFPPEEIARRERVYRSGCMRAATVAVASSWIKEDVVAKYGLPEERVQVIPWAPSTQEFEPPPDTVLCSIRREYALPEEFALFPAMMWPHKNHLRLLEALALLRDRRGLKVRLVCTGKKGDFWPTIQTRVRDLGLEDQVQFLGMVPAENLRALYRLAQFVVVPTLFEAASGPLFEAWIEEVPVALAAVTSLPEQAGDAALLFDPLSVESMADAVGRMATIPDLRRELSARGQKRLSDFSWDRTARAYRAVYRRAAERELNEEDRRLLDWDWMRDPSGSAVEVDQA